MWCFVAVFAAIFYVRQFLARGWLLVHWHKPHFFLYWHRLIGNLGRPRLYTLATLQGISVPFTLPYRFFVFLAIRERESATQITDRPTNRNVMNWSGGPKVMNFRFRLNLESPLAKISTTPFDVFVSELCAGELKNDIFFVISVHESGQHLLLPKMLQININFSGEVT